MPLPINIDATYPDDNTPPPVDGRRLHQQYHDLLHGFYNVWEGIAPDAKADAGHTHAIAPHPDLAAHDALGLATQAELDIAVATRQALSEKAQPSGYASLDSGGKVPTGQLPALAITSVHVVANEAAMLALAVEEGDVAIRIDFIPRRAFILRTNDPTLAVNWEALDPATTVTSVNGATGDVTGVVLSSELEAETTARINADALLTPLTDPRLSDARTPTVHTHPYVETTTLVASGKGFVAHGTNANVARPSGYASIEWFGTVEPTNAVNGDTWNNPT